MRCAARRTPALPTSTQERADAIARHTVVRGSGRIGRSAAAKELEPEALTLAVVASVRHADTAYDQLLMGGVARFEARQHVTADVEAVLDRWRGGSR